MKFLYEEMTAAISTDVEAAVNTPFTDDEDFVGVRMNATPPPTPELDWINDDDQIGRGDGDEGGDEQRANYWQPRRFPVGGKLNTELAGRLLLRGAGGAVTNTVVTAAESWDATNKMQTKAEGRTPKLSSLLSELGGASFLWPSMAVNSFFVNFEGQNPVTYESELINLGHWQRIADVVGITGMPDPEDYHFMHPAAVLLTYNDGAPRNYAADGRLISGRIGFTNNIAVQGLPGDGFHTANNPASGAYAREVHRARRSYEASIQIYLDENFEDLDTLIANVTTTNLLFRFRGDFINETDYFEVEMKAPKCRLRRAVLGTFNDFATVTLNYLIQTDPVSGSRLLNRVRHAAGLTYR